MNGVNGDRFLKLEDVIAKTAISKSTIYRWIAEGYFPKQIMVRSCARWSLLDIERWMLDKRSANTSVTMADSA